MNSEVDTGRQVPRAVQTCHELLAWLIPLLDHFPRSRRFTLGERLEVGLLAVLEDLVDAAYTADKRPALWRANRRLAVCRHLWRLALELKVINLKRYEYGAKLIEDLGRQIGGWLESAPAAPTYFPGNGLLTPLDRRGGIPIGNLTSQFFANLYLNGLDHGIKEVLRAPAYLRYVDDGVLLDDDKGQLLDWRDWIADQLATLRLQLHLDQAHVSQTREGLNLLGYHVLPHRRRLRNDNGLRFRRRLRAFAKGYAEGRLDWADFNPSVQAWIGHACHADTLGLRESLFAALYFQRERAEG